MDCTQSRWFSSTGSRVICYLEDITWHCVVGFSTVCHPICAAHLGDTCSVMRTVRAPFSLLKCSPGRSQLWVRVFIDLLPNMNCSMKLKSAWYSWLNLNLSKRHTSTMFSYKTCSDTFHFWGQSPLLTMIVSSYVWILVLSFYFVDTF